MNRKLTQPELEGALREIPPIQEIAEQTAPQPSPPQIEHSFLKVDEVAKWLRVTNEQVSCLIRTGQLAAVNVGSGTKRPLYRIKPNAVDEFLARRSEQPVTVRRPRPRPAQPVDFFPELE